MNPKHPNNSDIFPGYANNKEELRHPPGKPPAIPHRAWYFSEPGFRVFGFWGALLVILVGAYWKIVVVGKTHLAIVCHTLDGRRCRCRCRSCSCSCFSAFPPASCMLLAACCLCCSGFSINDLCVYTAGLTAFHVRIYVGLYRPPPNRGLPLASFPRFSLASPVLGCCLCS